MVDDFDSSSISSEFTWHKTKVCQKMSLALFIRQNRKKTLPFKNNHLYIYMYIKLCACTGCGEIGGKSRRWRQRHTHRSAGASCVLFAPL